MICITGSALSVGLFGVGAVLGASIADVTDWGAAPGLALMFIGRILHGVTGGTAAAAQAIIVDVTPPAQRTQALGLVGVAIGLGFVIGPGAASWLMEIHLSLPIAIAVAIFSLDSLNPFQNMIQTLSHPRVGPLSLGFGLFFIVLYSCVTILVPFVSVELGGQPGDVGQAFALLGVMAIVVQGVLLGPLSRWLGEQCLAPMGIGLVMPSVRAMISRRLDAGNQGQTRGSLQALQSLGASVGPITAGILSPMWRPLPRFRLPC